MVGVDSGRAGTGAGVLSASDAVAVLAVVSVASADAVFPVFSGALVVSALCDVFELVWASPLLATASLAVAGDAGSDNVDVVLDADPDADFTGRVAAPADVGVDAHADDSAEPAERDVESDPDDADEFADDDPVGKDERFESDGWAHATPCPVTTAAPTPRATANPPTRPTYAALIRFSFFGTCEEKNRTNLISRLLS